MQRTGKPYFQTEGMHFLQQNFLAPRFVYADATASFIYGGIWCCEESVLINLAILEPPFDSERILDSGFKRFSNGKRSLEQFPGQPFHMVEFRDHQLWKMVLFIYLFEL